MALTWSRLEHLHWCFHHPPLQFVVPCGTFRTSVWLYYLFSYFLFLSLMYTSLNERKPYRPNQIHTSFYAVSCKWINVQCSLMCTHSVGGAVRQTCCGWWMVALSPQSGSALLWCMFYARVPTQCSQTLLLNVGVCVCVFIWVALCLFVLGQNYLDQRTHFSPC